MRIISAHPNLLFANFFVNLSICFFSWSVVPKAYRLDKYGGSVCCLGRGVDLVIPSADRRNHLETQKKAQDDKVSGYLGNIHVEISSCWSLREWNRCFSNKTWQTRYKYSIIDHRRQCTLQVKRKFNWRWRPFQIVSAVFQTAIILAEMQQWFLQNC